MPQNIQRTEGIVLHTLPFRDYDRILTLFTLELGIVKTIMRKSLITKAIQTSTDPLSRAEFVLAPGKSDLMQCYEISLISQNLKLRERLSWLQAGCDMAQALTRSQMQQKPAPALYRLLISYIDKVPTHANPQVLVSSFYIKMMRHEGLLSLENNSLETTAYSPPAFSQKELDIIHILNSCRTFTELATLELSPDLSKKVKDLFNELFS